MSPGEHNEDEFIQDIEVGDVEIVFKGGYRDVAIELYDHKFSFMLLEKVRRSHSVPYIPDQLPSQSSQPGIPSERWVRS